MITTDMTAYRIHEDVIEGKRLGRHVLHDPRSLAYWHRRTATAPVAVLHERRIRILDQGNVGSCTTNAQVGECGTEPMFSSLSPAQQASLDEPLCVAMYSEEEVAEGFGPYPPNDEGGTGLYAAKVALKRGLIKGYTHMLSVADMTDAMQKYPLSIGINWYDSFDEPPASGILSIGRGAGVRGGHQLVLRGVDPGKQQFYGDNSWSESWGPLGGSFILGFDTMDRLLGEDGDATQSLPLDVPAPVADPDLAHWAVVGPWAAKHRDRPDLVTVQKSIWAWGSAHGFHNP